MHLLILLAILVIAILIYNMMCGSIEFLTPSPFVLSWTGPQGIDTGCQGTDCGCCTYDWQISDSNNKMVDSGTTAANVTTVSTTKLDWVQTYTVKIRASNKYGPGEWTSTTLSTGTYQLSGLVIADMVNPDGTVAYPIGIGSSIAVYTKLVPNNKPGLLAFTTINIVRSGKTIPVVTSEYSLENTGGYFYYTVDKDSMSASLQEGDTVYADVLVTDPDRKTTISEITGSIVITGGTPGPISSISLTYSPTTPPVTPFYSYPNLTYSGSALGNTITGTVEDCENACQNGNGCDYFVFTPSSPGSNTGTCTIETPPANPGWTAFWQTSPGVFLSRDGHANLGDPNIGGGNANFYTGSAALCMKACEDYNTANPNSATPCTQGRYCYDKTKCDTGAAGGSCNLLTFNTEQGQTMYVRT